MDVALQVYFGAAGSAALDFDSGVRTANVV